MKSTPRKLSFSRREMRVVTMYREGWKIIDIMTELTERESFVRAVIQKATQTKP